MTLYHFIHIGFNMNIRQEEEKLPYLRFYEVLSQVNWDKVLQALHEAVSPQTAKN